MKTPSSNWSTLIPNAHRTVGLLRFHHWRRCFAIACLLSLAVTQGPCQTYVDLTVLFNVDAVLEAGGSGIGNGLDTQGRRIDGATLPSAYTDGSAVTTQDGRARFKFGPFRQSALDALLVDGQVLDVADGTYESLDLAMISAPGALAFPFGNIELRYSDTSKEQLRLGPVPGWFNSPMAFDHTLYRYTDSSQVQTLVSFRTDWGDVEANYLAQSAGNGNSGGNRFVDGHGYALYRIGDLGGVQAAKLGVTVGNNFVISLATEYHDPSWSTTDGYTVVADSMEMYGVDHHALGNLKQYDIDLTPYLASGTGELYILFTDGSPNDGWGPYIRQILVYTGTPRTFEQVLEPLVETNRATVYAMFKTSTDAEKPFLFDNSASGPSNRGHRFADGTQSLTYRFDLPDSVTDEKLMIDMANNFIVSLAGPSDVVNYFSMTAGTSSPDEANFLVDAGGSAASTDFRFADGTAYMIYQFDLPDDVTNAFAKIRVGNEFVIEAATGTAGDFKLERDWVAETGQETHDISNLDFYTVDLAAYLTNNPTKVVQLRLSDGVPSDGWGPYLKGISIVNSTNVAGYQMVLNSQSLYGEDIHDEYNKKYYTVSLASVLANNPRKEFSVQFTDGSTSDGWGPGVFWMAVYSGELSIVSDQLVFNDLKTTAGDPQNYGAGFLHRRYPVNASKTLAAIALPPQTTTEDNKVYLLGATLNSPAVAPKLSVTSVPPNKVRLSWPATALGYRLQRSSNLASLGSWADVQDTPQISGDQLMLDLTATGSGSYYRLTK